VGFTSAADRQRIEAFVRRCWSLPGKRPNPDAAIADNDENLFRKMLYNVQKQFLPGVTNHQYHVRQRRHNDCLTGKTDDKRLCIFGLKGAIQIRSNVNGRFNLPQSRLKLS